MNGDIRPVELVPDRVCMSRYILMSLQLLLHYINRSASCRLKFGEARQTANKANTAVQQAKQRKETLHIVISAYLGMTN